MWPVGWAPFRVLCLGSWGLGGPGAGLFEGVVGGRQRERVFEKRSPRQEPKPPPLPRCSHQHETQRESLLGVLGAPQRCCLGAPPLQGGKGGPAGEGCWGLQSPLPQKVHCSAPWLPWGPRGRRLLASPPVVLVQAESFPGSKAFCPRWGLIWAAPFRLQEGEMRGRGRAGSLLSSLRGSA